MFGIGDTGDPASPFDDRYSLAKYSLAAPYAMRQVRAKAYPRSG
jgi:hypothetical protein